MLGGFTQVDKINGPVATPQTLINSLNDGRYVLNYIGHGSGTSWSNTGFSVTNAYQLANGWKNPYLCDVACLNGNFTLNECLAEALLRAGDTANPKGLCYYLCIIYKCKLGTTLRYAVVHKPSDVTSDKKNRRSNVILRSYVRYGYVGRQYW